MPLTPFDHAIIGGISGTVEVSMMQPTIALKNAFQEGRPISLTPGHLYRGIGMNIVSMAPITATQFGANFGYNSLHHSLTGRAKMTEGERMVTAFAAGATSAMVANPTELVVVRQQQNGRSLGTEIRDIISRLGVRSIGVGVYASMLREGIYGCCWMEMMPIMRQSLEAHPAVRDSLPAGSAHLVAGVTTGVLAATASHPFDTIKTRMQAFIEPTHPKHESYSSLSRTVTTILRDDGASAFFSGLGPRAFRIVCAVFILSFCRAEIGERYEAAKDKLAHR